MKCLTPFIVLLFLFSARIRAQDTFSILAFDSITREVGAAGASCVDLFGYPFTDHFIAEIFPDTGAVATQAAYTTANQAAARNRMRQGDSPVQMMTWLEANIPSSNLRQFGAVRFGHPSAAFTGSICTDYKGHIVGPNYTIHGNILLGPQVLDSMEARFNREKGDLACKLMAAMQGAKMQGADTRCHNNNSSSLFAFLKVSLPTDTFGKPSFLVSVRTQMGDSIEPVDSLQKLFDIAHSCVSQTVTSIGQNATSVYDVYPNPAVNELVVTGTPGKTVKITVTDPSGRVFFQVKAVCPARLNIPSPLAGIYIVVVEEGGRAILRKKVVFRDN